MGIRELEDPYGNRDLCLALDIAVDLESLIERLEFALSSALGTVSRP